MLQVQGVAEQRQHQRFQTKDRAVAMLVNWSIRFDIIDISNNGLSFLYLGKDRWFDELSELDIAFGDELFLKKIPIVSISDSTFKKSLLPMRRHSVMFHKLESHQQDQLQNFILSCRKAHA
jgi:hypothetical protein